MAACALAVAATVMLLGYLEGGAAVGIGQAWSVALALPLLLVARNLYRKHLCVPDSEERGGGSARPRPAHCATGLDGIVAPPRAEAGSEYRDLGSLIQRFGPDRVNDLLERGDLELMQPGLVARIGLAGKPRMARLSQRAHGRLNR